jgi:predicted RNA-binding protein with TRAM domain
VAAGNAGPGASTVGTPGGADAAPTVGVVDRDDSLASFSSRGPRSDDGAVKPDVTAPRVGVIAALAAGTTLGDPVGADHVALSVRPSPRTSPAPPRCSPSIPTGDPVPSVRTGDVLSVYVPEFGDSGAGHSSFAEAGGFERVGDTVTAEVYRNGKQVARSDTGVWGSYEVHEGGADYRLDLTTARVSDDWRFAPGARTSWSFRSAPPPAR